MASGWLWQGTTEAPTHCVFHYPSAPGVPIPPPSCYSHVSSDNTYNFAPFAPVAPPYPAYSAQCVRVTFVRKPGAICERPQRDVSRAATKYQLPVQPPGPGPGTDSASGSNAGPASGPTAGAAKHQDLRPDPPHTTAQAPTLILVASSAAGVRPRTNFPAQKCDYELDKSLYTHAKRLSRIRHKPRLSQHISVEHVARRKPPLRIGAAQRRPRECTGQDKWVVWARSGKVTKRVSGTKTPHPYQRRRKTLIQRHLLQTPGDQHPCVNVNVKSTHRHCVLLAADYEHDVMTYLLEVETRHLRTHNYLTAHPSVSQRTRAILVDWLIQVQSYLGVSRETLYQAVAMVDRVLEGCCIPVQRVQLLAVTCLLIASKLEEQRPVETDELLHLTLNSYTHEELLTLERRVLQVLNFDLTYADPTVFLGYFLYLTCNTQDQTVNDCCGFLIEVVMVETWPLETRPSLLAAAALHGALMVVYGTLAASAVPLLMPKYFNLKEEEIVVTSLRLLEALTNRFHIPFQGAESKYASESRHRALARHPSLQPLHLYSVVAKVRATLIHLRGENIVIRSSQHSCLRDQSRSLPDAAPSPARSAAQYSGATTTKDQLLLTHCEEDGSLLVTMMEEG